MKINTAYKYIFEILSDRLALDITTVEELILDGPTVSLLYYNSFKISCKSFTWAMDQKTQGQEIQAEYHLGYSFRSIIRTLKRNPLYH